MFFFAACGCVSFNEKKKNLIRWEIRFVYWISSGINETNKQRKSSKMKKSRKKTNVYASARKLFWNCTIHFLTKMFVFCCCGLFGLVMNQVFRICILKWLVVVFNRVSLYLFTSGWITTKRRIFENHCTFTSGHSRTEGNQIRFFHRKKKKQQTQNQMQNPIQNWTAFI